MSWFFLNLLGNCLEKSPGAGVGVDAIVLELTASKTDALINYGQSLVIAHSLVFRSDKIT